MGSIPVAAGTVADLQGKLHYRSTEVRWNRVGVSGVRIGDRQKGQKTEGTDITLTGE